MHKNSVTSDKAVLITLLRELCLKHTHIALICDEGIKTLHIEPLLGELELDIPIFYNKAGEAGKTRESKAAIEDFLFETGLGRDDLVIAIGGGALLDVASFAASSYLRGINYVSLPTTLLAMCDAAIGGKTAINTPYGKNTLGSFFSPTCVISYLPFLQTLSASKMLDGAAEVLKYSLISAPHLRALLSNVWFDKDHERLFFLEKLVIACQKIKQEIVASDPFDKAERKLLNFGHTVAHSLEALSHFSLSHGHAVAIGMAVEAFISHEVGLASKTLAEEIISYLQQLGFELNILEPRSSSDYLEFMRRDKKNHADHIHMVLLKKWGWCHIHEGLFTHRVDEKLVIKALDWMSHRFAKEDSILKA